MKIKCSECGKEYDYKLDVCSNCGYQNKEKKIVTTILYIISIILVLISLYKCLEIFYNNKFIKAGEEFLKTKNFENLSGIFEWSNDYYEKEKYEESYGSEEYGETAYNINNLRICSMCFCIVTIWIGIYLKNKDIKIGTIIKYIAIVIFILFQLLPTGYVLYVRNTPREEVNYNTNTYEELIPIKEK